jgi:hypothetical protein
MQRPLCTVCNERPRAYGYKKGTKIYWRSKCDTCIRKQKKLKTGGKTKWSLSGYRKKPRCELCGFKAIQHNQMAVYHVDGNRNNVIAYNLKTICANCQRLKSTQELGWSIGDLEVDA